ncbi:MAG: GAF domain-containing protein [Cyclobacteriaceae bacterium]
MNWAILKQSKPFRYTTIVAAAGLMATLVTWYTHSQWKHFQQLNQASVGWIEQTSRIVKKMKEGEQGSLAANLLSLRENIQAVYDGKKGLPHTDEITKVLLQKSLADMATLTEILDNPESSEEAISGAIMMVSSSIQGLGIHYQEHVKAQMVRASVMSAGAIIVLLILTIGASGFVFVFFKKIFTSHETAEKKFKEEEARVDKLTRFIEAMSSGNYDLRLERDGEEDDLTQSLITMRDKLLLNAEEDKRRNWATTGLAKIGEILRSSTSSTALYDSIISFVVKYTHSNQGGLFLYDDEDSTDTLELAACYAFERKKFLTRKIDISQGLVGQCFLEKEKIYMTNVPQDYIQITSGLGGENPGACLLVPLKVNDQAFGVIELASFKPYQPHEIELVEKFAESIASTISNVRINESTKLLLERTQQQAEEMKSQEEEMRQNMEELSATQEEMQRKEVEYINRIQELEGQLMVVEKQ